MANLHKLSKEKKQFLCADAANFCRTKGHDSVEYRTQSNLHSVCQLKMNIIDEILNDQLSINRLIMPIPTLICTKFLANTKMSSFLALWFGKSSSPEEKG
ncbi:hypothetical protein NL108_009704 [Boleophthalmus pectinirostris]|nr:hypothetical protein NL108_009704 [Boleophthalmus pectinirostris]